MGIASASRNNADTLDHNSDYLNVLSLTSSAKLERPKFPRDSVSLGPEPIVSRCQAPSPRIKILKIWVADFRAGTPPRSGGQFYKLRKFFRPPGPRILASRRGSKKKRSLVGRKTPFFFLSFIDRKRNSYPKSSEIKVNYKIYVQGFSCRHAAEPRIKKGLEKGMRPGGQKKSLSFENFEKTVPP